MSILIQELKANTKSMLLWSCAIILLISLCVVKTVPMIQDSPDMLNDFLSAMPPVLKGLFGTSDLSSIRSIFILVFSYVQVLISLHAAILGANILTKEERDHTFEFLYVKGKTRNQIITSKLQAAFIIFILLDIVFSLTSLITVWMISSDPISDILMPLSISLCFTQVIFFSISIALSQSGIALRKVMMVCGNVTMGCYMLSFVIDLSESLSFLSFLTPFQYFKANDILESGFQIVYLLLSLIIILISLYFTYYKHTRKDLSV